MSAFSDEIRAAVEVAIAPLHAKIDRLEAALADRAERITLQTYRGDPDPRAAAAFERRHPDLMRLSVVIGKRRYYARAELDQFFRGAQ